jgi:uncharacterized membrane protein YdcZ (DUF606 family)
MWILILLSMAGGMAVAAQALINARLQLAAGNSVLAATLSFAVGLTALLAVLALQPAGAVTGHSLGSAPWWAWIGGALGGVLHCRQHLRGAANRRSGIAERGGVGSDEFFTGGGPVWIFRD